MPIHIADLVINDGKVTRDGNLTVAVASTEWDIGGEKGSYTGSSGNAVTDDDTSYVYLNDSGTLVINTTGFPTSATPHARLATVVAVGGVITDVVDKRAHIQGTGSSSSGVITENGFEDASDSTISFVDGTRTFTIQPAVSSYVVWAGGIQYTKTSADNKVIADTEGIHFLYFDSSGVLQETTTYSDDIILTYAFCAVVHWDATNNVSVILADERHGRQMDGETHLYLHQTRGARLITSGASIGFALGDITADGDGSSDSHAQCSVDDGEFRDEDVKTSVVDGSPQELSPICQVPVLYRSGSSGDWRKVTATNFPITTTGTGRAAWNEDTGSTWQLTEVSNNSFVLVHLLATPDTRHPIVAILGQAEYTNLGAARTGAEVELQSLAFGQLAGLAPEFVALATLIFQTSNSYTNTVKSRIRSTSEGDDYIDWRAAQVNSVGGATQDHGALAGLDDDDHTHYHTDARGDARYPPLTRDLTAGAGLTGGGDLSADRTFTVGANGDGSISVNADDIQVGVLATDGQHGTRGGGTQHSAATTGTAGFMSAADKTKLDGIDTGATNTPLSDTAPVDVTKAAAAAGSASEASRQDHKHDITTAAPGATGVATASGEGSATTLARSDHTHQANTAPADVTKAAAAIGTSGEPARADHKHDATTAAAGAITPGDSASEGSATSLSRSDHQHSIAAFGSSANTFAEGNDSRFVTNGDSHDHNGGDGAQIDHTTLSNIGTNAHTAIDTHIAAAAPHSGHATTSHAPTHIRGGSDEVDGDKLDIDWNPTNYTPATTPTEVTHVDELTAHLYGIDQALAATGPYGSEYQQASSESESSTTGDLNYHQKVRLTTTTVPAGDYLVQWYCEWAADGDDTTVKFKVELDDTTVLAEIKPRDKGKYVDGVFHFWSGSKVHTLTNASHTLDFDYGHEEADNRIVYIRRARIILWRVS